MLLIAIKELVKMLTKTPQAEMTSGPILKNIIAFAVPVIITNPLQVLYSVSDTVIVSLSSEPDAVGAIGTTTAMINLVVNMFIDCAVGAKVAMAQSIGAKGEAKIKNTVHTSLMLIIIFGIICACVGIILAKPILATMGNKGKLLALALIYTKTYFFGVPFISVTNFATALINATSNTRTPLRVMTFSGLLNILLNLFFVLTFHMSVDGMAIATVLSNAASAVLQSAKALPANLHA